MKNFIHFNAIIKKPGFLLIPGFWATGEQVYFLKFSKPWNTLADLMRSP